MRYYGPNNADVYVKFKMLFRTESYYLRLGKAARRGLDLWAEKFFSKACEPELLDCRKFVRAFKESKT